MQARVLTNDCDHSRCRRVESLLQRGLDVDYVAQEADYRYTYLFPSPYSGPERR